MKLIEYIKEANLSYKEFAEKIGTTEMAVRYYVKGRVPTPKIMRKIIEATAGTVRPNDFYGVR